MTMHYFPRRLVKLTRSYGVDVRERRPRGTRKTLGRRKGIGKIRAIERGGRRESVFPVQPISPPSAGLKGQGTEGKYKGRPAVD